MPTAAELRPLLRPWLAALAQRSEATARNYRVSCSQFLEALGSRELDPETVADYLDSLRGLAPGSRAAKISAVRSFLKLAQDQGVIERSPRELLIRPKVTVTSYGRYLDLAEMRRLIAAARELGALHYALVLLMWTTGARVGEIAGAEWRDLFADPEGRIGWRIVGKGGKERVAKITPDVLQALAALHGSSELDASDSAPLFPSPCGGGYSTWSLWSKVRETAQAAGITKPVSCHWLRHSFGTWSAHGGASAFQIQWAMGHSKLETSARYVHMATGLRETATDRLPQL